MSEILTDVRDDDPTAGEGGALPRRKPTIALAIPHTPWIHEREGSFIRLRDRLGLDMLRDLPAGVAIPRGFGSPLDHVRVFSDREPNWAWSERLWRWGLETGADYLVQLQDDVIVAPNFWPALRAMLGAVPDQVIGLEAAHPYGKRLAQDGHRWCSTSDYLVGPGYVLPRALLEEFLRWRRDALKPRAVEEISEDSLIGLWCYCTGRRVFHPIPTIIDHDVTIESSYGNDGHSCRRPSVAWEDCAVLDLNPTRLEDPDFWRGGAQEWWTPERRPDHCPHAIPHLGTVYAATPHLARMWLRRPETVPTYETTELMKEAQRWT